MKTKQVIASILTKKDINQIKMMTAANIAYKMMSIFRSHIGEFNAISRARLFRKIFGRAEEITLADDLRWEFVKRAMHLCRQRTRCFIVSKYENATYKYFVVNTMADAQYYIDTLNRNIARMRIMQKKVVKSVNEKWSQLDWSSEMRNKLR